MLFVEDNTQTQKLFLSTRPKAGFIFHLYRDYLKISLCWEWKYNVFVSSRKKYRGPEIDRCLDQRKKTCYIISRTIYLQICIFMNWNKYHAINTPCPRGLGNKENLVIENELLWFEEVFTWKKWKRKDWMKLCSSSFPAAFAFIKWSKSKLGTIAEMS